MRTILVIVAFGMLLVWLAEAQAERDEWRNRAQAVTVCR